MTKTFTAIANSLVAAQKQEPLLAASEFSFFNKPLFFSGGSALKEVSSALSALNVNSAHVVTTFDSGGSSAMLRSAFNMPAVGDLRSRIIALANIKDPVIAATASFFSRRFSFDTDLTGLYHELNSIIAGRHVWLKTLTPEFVKFFCSHLAMLQQKLPVTFNLRGASIGNLVLTAEYLQNGRNLQRAVEFFTRLLQCCGIVAPVCEENVHLGVESSEGRVLLGQHSFTGKSGSSPQFAGCINKMFYFSEQAPLTKITPPCAENIFSLVAGASLICYPIGSFYSSIMANIALPGVGKTIVANPCLKVFIPNPGFDAETSKMSMQQQLEVLTGVLLSDAKETAVTKVLNYVLVDESNGEYGGDIAYKWCAENGVKLVSYNFAEKRNNNVVVNSQKTVAALATFCALH